MEKLKVSDLMSLEAYHRERAEFRKRALEHKKPRQVAIGDNVTLYFEDRLTIQYQVQEMLRIERVFEAEAIEDELGAYNPLIPDGSNFKATFMIEIEDEDERRRRLRELVGIEDRLYVQVNGHGRSYASCDEDLERRTEDKTSSVHFARFELDAAMKAALQGGAGLRFGIDHPRYTHEVEVGDETRNSLVGDLD